VPHPRISRALSSQRRTTRYYGIKAHLDQTKARRCRLRRQAHDDQDERGLQSRRHRLSNIRILQLQPRIERLSARRDWEIMQPRFATHRKRHLRRLGRICGHISRTTGPAKEGHKQSPAQRSTRLGSSRGESRCEIRRP